MRVPLRDGRTLHHDIEGRHGAGKVIMRTAVPGTGIIAGGPMRAVFEVMGITEGRVSQLHSQALSRLRKEFHNLYGEGTEI